MSNIFFALFQVFVRILLNAFESLGLFGKLNRCDGTTVYLIFRIADCILTWSFRRARLCSFRALLVFRVNPEHILESHPPSLTAEEGSFEFDLFNSCFLFYMITPVRISLDILLTFVLQVSMVTQKILVNFKTTSLSLYKMVWLSFVIRCMPQLCVVLAFGLDIWLEMARLSQTTLFHASPSPSKYIFPLSFTRCLLSSNVNEWLNIPILSHLLHAWQV
jgi:hypothetical protein